MPAQLITHKGKTILYIDYRNQARAQDLLRSHRQGERYIAKELQGKVLILADFRDATLGTDIMEYAKSRAEYLAPRLEKMAFLGITGLKTILLDGYRRSMGDEVAAVMVAFESEEEALEWLVS